MAHECREYRDRRLPRRAPLAALLLLTMFTGCARREAVVTAGELQSAAPNSGFWTRAELYFGMNIPAGGLVSDSAWTVFLEREIAPRLPEGFTVFESVGYYLNRTTGKTEREPSRVLLVYYREDQPQAARALTELATLYKQRFNQQSVLRVTARVKASF
jgi:uncharacterized protein DUF3574